MAKYLESLVQVVEHKITNMIIAGKLELGSRITEAELASMLSISTAPVHQALHVLSRMGIVIVKPRKGTYIFNFTVEDIRKMTLARYAVESVALREAFKNNPSRLCLEMSKLISESEAPMVEKERAKYLKFDADFHELLFQYADNEFLTMAANAITIKVMVLRNLRAVIDYTLEDMRVSFEDHLRILDKILDGDVDSACEILDIHLKRLEVIYLRGR